MQHISPAPLLQPEKEHKTIIEAIDICKEYAISKLNVQALKGVNLRIMRGEVVAIMGPSGCGKTTLLNCLSGLDAVTSGTIRIAGHDIRSLSDRELTAFRACEMGFVFQTYNLLPVLNGLENVELPLLVSGVAPKEARTRARASIERVGLTGWARHRPTEMSGGQRQRFPNRASCNSGGAHRGPAAHNHRVGSQQSCFVADGAAQYDTPPQPDAHPALWPGALGSRHHRLVRTAG